MMSTVQYSTSAFSPIMILSDLDVMSPVSLVRRIRKASPTNWPGDDSGSTTAYRCVRRGVVGHSPPQGSWQCGVSRDHISDQEHLSYL